MRIAGQVCLLCVAQVEGGGGGRVLYFSLQVTPIQLILLQVAKRLLSLPCREYVGECSVGTGKGHMEHVEIYML